MRCCASSVTGRKLQRLRSSPWLSRPHFVHRTPPHEETLRRPRPSLPVLYSPATLRSPGVKRAWNCGDCSLMTAGARCRNRSGGSSRSPALQGRSNTSARICGETATRCVSRAEPNGLGLRPPPAIPARRDPLPPQVPSSLAGPAALTHSPTRGAPARCAGGAEPKESPPAARLVPAP